jgi:hypothetical protein
MSTKEGALGVEACPPLGDGSLKEDACSLPRDGEGSPDDIRSPLLSTIIGDGGLERGGIPDDVVRPSSLRVIEDGGVGDKACPSRGDWSL